MSRECTVKARTAGQVLAESGNIRLCDMTKLAKESQVRRICFVSFSTNGRRQLAVQGHTRAFHSIQTLIGEEQRRAAQKREHLSDSQRQQRLTQR